MHMFWKCAHISCCEDHVQWLELDESFPLESQGEKFMCHGLFPIKITGSWADWSSSSQWFLSAMLCHFNFTFIYFVVKCTKQELALSMLKCTVRWYEVPQHCCTINPTSWSPGSLILPHQKTLHPLSNSPLLPSPAPDSTALHCVSRNLTTWEWFSLHVGTKCSPLGTRLRNYGGKSGGGSMSQTVHPHWHLSTVHNFPSVSTKTMKDHSHRAAAKERSGGLSCSCCVSMETNHGGYWVTYLWNIPGYDHHHDILLITEVPLQRRLFSHYSRTAREAAWCGAQQSKGHSGRTRVTQ